MPPWIGRFKVGRLMAEFELISKQPGSHAYKRDTIERMDIPNCLNQSGSLNSESVGQNL